MEKNYKIIHNDPPENYKNDYKLKLDGKIHPLKEKIKLTKILDQIKFNSKYVKFSVLPQIGVAVDARIAITADNIAEFAYPLVQFIEQVRPDYIVACDRGARIIGLAVHMLYKRLYGALPTQDHAIHFRKISRNVPADTVRNVLRPDIQRMLATVESPTVFVLDDWVITGGTKSLAQNVFSELSGDKINVLYGVMRGAGADITGSKNSTAFGDWHDKPDLIGVDYFGSALEPHKVKSPVALEYRKKMSESIRRFVQEHSLQHV